MQYKSTQSGEVLTGLDDYISRMKEGQKGIYFVTAESDALAANSPFVESLEKKGMEVRTTRGFLGITDVQFPTDAYL